MSPLIQLLFGNIPKQALIQDLASSLDPLSASLHAMFVAKSCRNTSATVLWLQNQEGPDTLCY